MQSQTLNALLAGQFICPIAFEQAFEDLQDPVTRDEIEQWLTAPAEEALQLQRPWPIMR